MTDPEVIAHLNDLIHVAEDGQHGYATAAEHVNNSRLRSTFTAFAAERAGFVRELSTEVARLGGEPAHSGTVTAAIHRGWIDIKSVLTGGGAGAIVSACETGEDSAKAAYERVVNLDISGSPRVLAESQLRKVTEAHQHMVHLKEEIASGTEFPRDL